MYRNRNIKPNSTLLEALKKMDQFNCKLLVVENNDNFIGLLSAGDIQRAIIQTIPLNELVSKVLRSDIKVAHPEDSFESVKKMMFDYRMEFCPVIGYDHKVVEIFFWEDLFLDQKPGVAKKFNLPVVIMAGGRGSRLRPLTNVLPKPLLPIGEKTILEEIIDVFTYHGCDKYFISINYKANLIKYYLNSLMLPQKIDFVEENKPLGTAGSLSLLNGRIHQTLFVINCDILIRQDYSEILEYHYDQGNEITIVAALRHIPIKYGTIETGNNGHLVKLIEKPDVTLKLNSGMYILEPHLLNEIPAEKASDITDLIWSLHNNQRKVGVFPISQNSWTDIGDWNAYGTLLKESVNWPLFQTK